MQNRKKAPQGFVTAGEAIELLGIPQSSFFTLVREGIFTRTVFHGRKEGVYPEHEIRFYQKNLQSDQKGWSFQIALKEDIPEIRALIEANFSVVPPIPASLMEAWLRRNPEALHIMRKDGKLVGYFSILALPYETMMKRMRGEYLHRTIPLEDIQPFLPGKEHLLYFADAVVNLQENEQRMLGRKLLTYVAHFFEHLAEQDIRVTAVYAVGTTQLGIKICHSWKMEPLQLKEGVRPDRMPCVLTVATSSSYIMKRYRERLATAQHTCALQQSILA